jgi:hypothetical protein
MNEINYQSIISTAKFLVKALDQRKRRQTACLMLKEQHGTRIVRITIK